MMKLVRRILIGRPLHNQEISHEKLPKWKALAIFSSDALSSVAYGPEEIMLMLTLPGMIAYGYLAPISIAMGNAISEVKNIADYITDTNKRDGVAKAIEKFILK